MVMGSAMVTATKRVMGMAWPKPTVAMGMSSMGRSRVLDTAMAIPMLFHRTVVAAIRGMVMNSTLGIMMVVMGTAMTKVWKLPATKITSTCTTMSTLARITIVMVVVLATIMTPNGQSEAWQWKQHSFMSLVILFRVLAL